MKKFELKKVRAFVTKVNGRKEFHGDERILANDINLDINAPASVLSMLSVDDFPWETLLWNPNGEVAAHCLTRLQFHREFEESSVSIGERTFKHANLKKISAEPVPGKRINLRLQVQVYPDSQESGELQDLIQEESAVTISATPAPIQMEIPEKSEEKASKDKSKGKEAESRLNS